MVRSLYSGVAGLKSHQTKMDVIGNNIANVNTYGYKASRTTFSDIYYQAKASATGGTATYAGNNESAIGYGVQLSSIDKDMSSSSFQSTNRTLDLAISGDGFFMTATVDEMGAVDSVQYTRYGDFGVDSDGNLVSTGNQFVLGTRNDGSYSSNEMNTKVPADTAKELDTINVNELAWDAFRDDCMVDYTDVSTTVKEKGFVTEADDPYDDTNKVVADKDGNILYMVNGKYVNENGIVYDTDTGNYVDTNGDFYDYSVETADDGTKTYKYTGQNDGIEYVYDQINKFYEGTDDSGNKLYADMNDGSLKYSDLDGFTVGTNGILTATYASEIKAIARIELATFDNIEGLTQIGDTAFGESSASGQPKIKAPGTSGAGTTQSSKLEMSNVDLANEFSDMIVTQRGFQANARIITTSDSMLEELVNLKR